MKRSDRILLGVILLLGSSIAFGAPLVYGGIFVETDGTVGIGMGSSAQPIITTPGSANGQNILLFTSYIPAATATASVPAFRMKPANALDNGDLVFELQSSGGVSVFSVDINSVVTANAAASGNTFVSPAGTYMVMGISNGAPAAGDCNSDGQRGRYELDYSGVTGAHTLYICTGAADGWDHVTLTN